MGLLQPSAALRQVQGRCHPQVPPCRDEAEDGDVALGAPLVSCCAPALVAHTQPMVQQRWGPSTRLDPHRVRVVTQLPADIISINSGLCRN